MSDALGMTVAGAPAPGLWTILREDLACVFQRDPAARSKLEVLCRVLDIETPRLAS